MTQTSLLGLNLFDGSDPVLVSAINANTQKLDALPQIDFGTYTGNGSFGQDNPITLTFPRKPLLVAVAGADYCNIMVQGAPYAMNARCTADNTAAVALTWSGNSVTFRGNSSPVICNEPDQTAHYVAILE